MTPPNPPGPDADRLNRALTAWRTPFAVALVLIGLGCLVVSGYCFLKARQAAPAEEKTDAAVSPLDPPPKTDAGLGRGRTEYYLGGVVGAVAALVGLGAGGWTLGRLPHLAAGQADTRRVAAFAGGGLGLLLLLLGLGLFVLWFGTLVEWVGKKSSPDAWKVIAALLVFLLGGGLAFVSAQLLRADERDNQTLRRLAFGTNAGLSVVLLVVGLVAANVIVGLRLPARLDTTSTGFYTLHPDTAALLQNLTTSVTVYTTVTEEGSADEQDQRTAADLKRLLEQCQAANPLRFKYQILSPALNKSDIARLQAEHVEFKRPDYGVLVVADGKPGRFLPDTELTEFRRQTEKQTFLGEPKLVSLLLAVTEDTDQTVYVVQGHGEIAVGPRNPDGPAAPRTGARLTAALEKVGSTVRPLEFDLAAPKVPDDAAVVVLADPTAAIPADQLGALRSYMTAPRANGKKGKLLVLSSPRPNADGKGVVDTGLNALLGEFGLSLGNAYLYFNPTAQSDPTETDLLPVGISGQPLNPIVAQFERRAPTFVNCREVAVAGRRPGVEPLFLSYSGRVSWQEADPQANPADAWQALRAADQPRVKQLVQQKGFTQAERLLGVAVSEGGVGRVVAYGSGDAFADPPPRSAPKLATNPELLAATVNWLRDRPTAANITGKEVAEFRPNKQLDGYKGLLLPVFGTLIATAAVGLGVWVYRRK
jgi:hypothetical protein